MGLKECVISLDNAWSTYYPGQTINGLVTYTFDSPKEIRGINIKFKGEAQTKWTEVENRRNAEGQDTKMSIDHTANENYFNISYYLLGNKSGNKMELPAGTHSYPFTCALPPTLPSSFEGEFGFVRYTIKVTLDRPWKFDQESKMAFTVVSHMDLNTTPSANVPIRIHMEKNFCCCWCKSGPLNVDVELPVSGYCSGQSMPIEITCENGGNVGVNGITIKLLKTVRFRCQTPTNETKQIQITISELTVEGVEANSTKHFSRAIAIPPLPPSNLMNCSIIDLDYELKVICEVSGMHMNMDDLAPIIIGTVPLAGFQPPPVGTGENYPVSPEKTAADPLLNSGYPGQNMQGTYPAPNVQGPYPTAPPVMDNQFNMPQQPGGQYPGGAMYPPAQPNFVEGGYSAGTIHDVHDNQHTRIVGDMNFKPRYPTYGFVAPQ